MTRRPMTPRGILYMVKARGAKVGIVDAAICNHSLRATGITGYMEAGGDISVAAEYMSSCAR